MRTGYQKKKTAITLLICRITVLLLLVGFASSRVLVVDDFIPILYIVLPLSCFYVALSVVFIAKNKYLIKGKKGNEGIDNLGHWILILIYIIEIGLIIYKSLVDSLTGDTFYLEIAILESLLGIHAGLYLVYLFAFQNEETSVKPGTESR